MKRSLLVLAVLLLSCAFSFAADIRCARYGEPSDTRLWDGYHVQMAADSEHPDQCRATLLDADGKSIFAITAPAVTMLAATGQDVNADDKKDVVVESASANPCCYRYDILTPGNSPAMIREIVTTPRLVFADRDGTGHIDITTHEVVYLGIDGLDRDSSPTPMVVLRMRGASFYPVSQVFWADYERDIEQAKAGVPQSAFDKFFGRESAADSSGKPKEPSEEDLRAMARAKAAVLAIYLDQLYGGRPQLAMKTIADMWPDRDKDRIRQIILSLRMRGIMAEINRPTQAANPVPPAP